MKSIIIFILISFSLSQNIRKTDSLISVTITEIDDDKDSCKTSYSSDFIYIKTTSDVASKNTFQVTGLILKMNEETFELTCRLSIYQDISSSLLCHYNGEFSVTGDVYLSSSGDIVVGDGTKATLTLNNDLQIKYYTTKKVVKPIPTKTLYFNFSSDSEQDISLTFDDTIDYDIKFVAKLDRYYNSKLDLDCTTSNNTATCKLTKEMFSSYEDDTLGLYYLSTCYDDSYFSSGQDFYINKSSTEGITFTADYVYRNSNKCQKMIPKNTTIIFNTSSHFGLEEETHIDGLYINSKDEYMKCKIALYSYPNVTCVYENKEISSSAYEDGFYYLQARKEKIIFEGNTLVYSKKIVIPNYNVNHNELIYYPEKIDANFTDSSSDVLTFDIQFESNVTFKFYVSEEKEKTEGEKELEVEYKDTNVTIQVTKDVFVPANNDKIYYVNYVDACGNSITTTAVTVNGTNPTPTPTPSDSGKFIKISMYTLLLIGLILF